MTSTFSAESARALREAGELISVHELRAPVESQTERALHVYV